MHWSFISSPHDCCVAPLSLAVCRCQEVGKGWSFPAGLVVCGLEATRRILLTSNRLCCYGLAWQWLHEKNFNYHATPYTRLRSYDCITCQSRHRKGSVIHSLRVQCTHPGILTPGFFDVKVLGNQKNNSDADCFEWSPLPKSRKNWLKPLVSKNFILGLKLLWQKF